MGFQCKKDVKTQPIPEPPIVIETVKYTVDSTEVLPGTFATITSAKTITKDTSNVRFGTTQVLLFKLDQLHYAFLVPELAPGSYHLDLNPVNGEISPVMTVGTYQTVTNPDEVINNYVSSYEKIIDSIEKNDFADGIKSTELQLMRQLRTQLSKNVASLTLEQKRLAAYQIINTKFDRTPLGTSQTDTTYILGNQTTDQDPIEVTSPEIDFARLQLYGANLAFKAAIASAVLWRLSGTPHFGVSCLIAMGIYAYLKAKAWNQSNKTSHMVAYAESLSSSSGLGISSPIEVQEGSSFKQKILGKFRTFRRSDKQLILPTVTEFIELNEIAENEDLTVKGHFDKLKQLFGSLLTDVTATYTLYISPILTNAASKTIELKNRLVKITGISNSNISASISDVGTQGLEITFFNRDNNIVDQTEFTYQLLYTQPNTTNTVLLTLRATFKPGLKIGDVAHGGIVYYVEPSGVHGFVCAPADQSASTNWFNAHTICRTYRGGGFDDWSLPSGAELSMMFRNKGLIGGFSVDCTDVNFGNCSYWGAEENGTLFATNLFFTTGIFWSNYGKDGLARVRTVRKF